MQSKLRGFLFIHRCFRRRPRQTLFRIGMGIVLLLLVCRVLLTTISLKEEDQVVLLGHVSSSVSNATATSGADKSFDVAKSAVYFQPQNTFQSGIPSSSLVSSYPQSTSCSYLPNVTIVNFRPKEFMEHGLGAQFLELYHQQKGPTKRLLKVRFVLFRLTKTCTPVYYHIHKNGGTAMNIKSHPMVDAYYTPKENQLGRDKFFEQSNAIMTNVYETQLKQRSESNSNTTIPFFSFIRDPVPRFLSGVGQALKLARIKPCHKLNNSVELLDCVINKMNSKSSFLDEHLLPQVFHLYTGMMDHDIQVSLIDLSDATIMLNWLLDQLYTTADGHSVSSQPKSEHVRHRKTPQIVHGFNLSYSVLTPNLIARICRLYLMDVILIKATNVTHTICDAHE